MDESADDGRVDVAQQEAARTQSLEDSRRAALAHNGANEAIVYVGDCIRALTEEIRRQYEEDKPGEQRVPGWVL